MSAVQLYWLGKGMAPLERESWQDRIMEGKYRQANQELAHSRQFLAQGVSADPA